MIIAAINEPGRRSITLHGHDTGLKQDVSEVTQNLQKMQFEMSMMHRYASD